MFSSNTSQVSSAATFIEDVFSTWLYTGNGSTQTITNNIDLTGKGGLVWMKGRSGATDHALYDTVRGATFDLASNLTSAQTTQSTGLTGFLANGFSIGSLAKINTNAATYASWTFREQPKFFDIVTWTGNGVAGRQISHSLGSVPGCIIIKRTSAVQDWIVWHRAGSSGNNFGVLNSTAAFFNGDFYFNNTPPTSTEFTVNADQQVNQSGSTYVAYLFAHDAGGFGATGADNVISCGSFTTDGSGNATVNLGYEPQWIMYKRAVGGTGNWTILDTMRGWPVGGNDAQLQANTSGAETSAANVSDPNATGFSVSGISASSTFIYIAIRRGPMRTPTSGTSVFVPTLSAATAGTGITTNFPIDMQINAARFGNNPLDGVFDRLRGVSSNSSYVFRYLTTSNSDAENNTSGFTTRGWNNLGYQQNNWLNGLGQAVDWNFRRAPGFFDVVCYTGTGVARTVSHNLGVVPELWIIKGRNVSDSWVVGGGVLGSATDNNVLLNSTAANLTLTSLWQMPTATTIGIGAGAPTWGAINANAATYVTYLFASAPGVSKVGSYTGTGATQTINCGFSSGARFVLIKRTDSTGDWYVWDSARGIVAGNDPYLQINEILAEVTNTDWVDTAASGFELSNAGGNLVNTSGGSYIFLSVS